MIRVALALMLGLTSCSRPLGPAPAETASQTASPTAAQTATTATAPAPGNTPLEPAAAIRTDRSAYVLTRGKHGPETTVVATLRAPADRTLYILNCNGALSATLQRKVGEAWVYSLVIGSAACMSPPIVVPPSGEHTTSIYVNEGAGAIPDPQGGTMLKSGTYRVVWTGVLTSFDPNSNGRGFGPELPLEQRVSAPITLEVPVATASGGESR